MTPLSAERSRVTSVWAGRPMARFEPCPTLSAALPSASIHCTAASTSLASPGCKVSAIGAPLTAPRLRPDNEEPVQRCVHPASEGQVRTGEYRETRLCRHGRADGRARHSDAAWERPCPG